jgi:hypothetical protein
VSTDETTDASGRKVANFVIGVLENDQTVSEKTLLVMKGNVCSETHNNSALSMKLCGL